MNGPLYFDELAVGDSWRSPGRTVTQTDIVNFACLTGDFNPLHVDHEFAKETTFGRPVAHGLLGMSLVAGLGTNSPWASTTAFLGIRDWRFRLPIYEGDTLHVVTELLEKTPKGRRNGVVVWRRQLVNQAGEVVQEGEFETLVSLSHTQTHEQFRRQTASRAAEEAAKPRNRIAQGDLAAERLPRQPAAQGDLVVAGTVHLNADGEAPSRGTLRRITADVLNLADERQQEPRNDVQTRQANEPAAVGAA
jgi:acyl dehydratase